MVPGVGICPTFTISRAILSDAVVLVRGDRFYTVGSSATNLRAVHELSMLTFARLTTTLRT